MRSLPNAYAFVASAEFFAGGSARLTPRLAAFVFSAYDQ
jgi:hypothetical protein